MANTALEVVSKDRVRLANPYAHIDYLEDASPINLKSSQGLGEGTPGSSLPTAFADRRDRAALEARKVQASLWRSAVRHRNGKRPADPLEVLDPEAALLELGFQVAYRDGLGVFTNRGISFDVAGTIDATQKTVQIAAQFPLRMQRFTLAHELGHAVLHDLHGVLHRDRPFGLGDTSPDPHEAEANRFASCFLMPERHMRAEFQLRFLSDKFIASEATAFALFGRGLAEFHQTISSSRDLAARLAATTQFNGQHFASLADRFRVSSQAMTIRIEELGLIG